MALLFYSVFHFYIIYVITTNDGDYDKTSVTGKAGGNLSLFTGR